MIDSYIVSLVSKKLDVNEKNAMMALRLLEEGGTIPFVSRYRKEETGGLTDIEISNIVKEYKSIGNFVARQNTILKEIESQGKLDDELRQKILNAKT